MEHILNLNAGGGGGGWDMFLSNVLFSFHNGTVIFGSLGTFDQNKKKTKC